MTDVPETSQAVQLESVQFRAPVSESSLQNIGGLLNYLRANLLPVGSVVASELDQATFQAQIGSPTWVLADGRNVTGSAFQTLTGRANIADLRGRFPRMTNQGSGVDPHGELSISTQVGDQFGLHSHPGSIAPDHTHIAGSLNFNAHHKPGTGSGVVFADGSSEQVDSSTNNNVAILGNTGGTGTGDLSLTINPNGGNETNPKYTVYNFFVRIN